ncbi:MAG: site-2 protease family protein, partial [Clostridia bacterium]|nr:site-2 protease family protein [Clostridia bacterium]
ILAVINVRFPKIFSQTEFMFNFHTVLATFLYMFHIMNLSLAVFNLIPIPPLDGSRLAMVFLPDKLYFGFMKHEQTIQIILMIALFTGLLDVPLNFVISSLSSGMTNLIFYLAGFFI